MCIIIVHNKKNIPPDNYLCESMRFNNDGFGIMWNSKNNLHIYKAINLKPSEMLKKYKEVIKEADGNIVSHFRIRTHGGITAENCHPFYIRRGGEKTPLACAHNGQLSGFGSTVSPQKSDTLDFIDKILKNIVGNLENQENTLMLLNLYLQSEHSKIVLLNSKDKLVILNSADGIYDNDIWYSNNSYIPVDNVTDKYIKTDGEYTDNYYERYNYGNNYDYDYYNDVHYNPEVSYCASCGRTLVALSSINIGHCINCVSLSFYTINYCKYCGNRLSGEMEKGSGCCFQCSIDHDIEAYKSKVNNQTTKPKNETILKLPPKQTDSEVGVANQKN